MSGGLEACLPLLLAHEGGFVEHPDDPGGATKFGITGRTLARFRGTKVTREAVMALTRDKAGEVYRTLYWDAISGDHLPAGIDYAVFDAAVNSGVRQATLWLQRALGVTADGVIGPVTLAAAQKADPETVIAAICDKRLIFLQRLKTWPAFGRGWSKRVSEVRLRAIHRADERRSFNEQYQQETKMNDTQTFFASRTVWSNIIGLGALALSVTGYPTVGIDAGQVTDAVMQIIAAGSFVASTVFRILSKKKIAL
jgi:lysozyme family protein